MPLRCKYIALYVPDLATAESFYCAVFGMELMFRESEGDDRQWHTLEREIDWAEAEERGLRIDMAALQRDDFVLALFRGNPRPGAVHEICVELPVEELRKLPERLPPETSVEVGERVLRFEDPFGFCWAVHVPGLRFRSSGEIARRWIG